MEGTTGGVWGSSFGDFAGYREVGGWRGRLEGSGGTLWQILPGIGGRGGGGGGEEEGGRGEREDGRRAGER